METKLWLECIFDILKLAMLFAIVAFSYVAGYMARVKEERKYKTPSNVRKTRKKKLHY